MVVDTQSGGSRSGETGTAVETSALKGVICEETVRACRHAYGAHLRAIVLTGSLARDEATIVESDGKRKVQGDAEFFLFFHDQTVLPGAAALRRSVDEIESSLLQQQVRCRIGLSAVQTRYFRNLRPHIFAYELRKWGTVVWGDSNVLALVPEFAASEIPLEDGWRLLCNRVIELLEVVPGAVADSKDGGRDLRYRTAKLYLDMATSYLVFRGAYSPSYRERNERLIQLAKESSPGEDVPFSLRDFANRVAISAGYKLTGSIPEESFLTLSESNSGFDLWKDCLTFALGLWRWELTRLAGVQADLSDRELMQAWMQRQPFSQRLRGWLYVARKQGWVRSWADWPRWVRLAWQASPRYETVMELASRLVRSGGLPNMALESRESWQEPRDRLPKKDLFASLHVDWRVVVHEIAWNYHAYLEKTRA